MDRFKVIPGIAINGGHCKKNRQDRLEMRILFLDFDGVLNSRKFFDSQNKKRMSKAYKETDDFDPEAVKNLNHFLKETGAKIVVSSSWRVGKTVDELRDLAVIVGINSSLIIDKTTCDYVQGGRGAEIRKWLQEHKDVEKFIIFDDDDFDMEEMKEFMIRTDPAVGLTKEQAVQACERIKNGKTV